LPSLLHLYHHRAGGRLGSYCCLWSQSPLTSGCRMTIKNYMELGVVAQAYNPSYLGGEDWKDCSLRLVQAKCLWKSMSTIGLGMMVCASHPSYAEKHK
jgi:hypothetical protein